MSNLISRGPNMCLKIGNTWLFNEITSQLLKKSIILNVCWFLEKLVFKRQVSIPTSDSGRESLHSIIEALVKCLFSLEVFSRYYASFI